MSRCALATCYERQCVSASSLYPLGVITWSATIGTADFDVPDAEPGVYLVEEVLPGVEPRCMPVAEFTVLAPDTAMESPASPSPVTVIGLVLFAIGIAWTLARSGRGGAGA